MGLTGPFKDPKQKQKKRRTVLTHSFMILRSGALPIHQRSIKLGAWCWRNQNQKQKLIPRLYQFQLRMMMKKLDQGDNQKPVPAAPAVTELQQLLHSTGAGGSGWDRCWEEGVTPWDLGRPTPIIAHLHKSGGLPKGRALVPGCGTGYDVVEIACPERHVTGLDISHNAINKARQLFSSRPNAMHFTFLKVDFFTWHPTDLFDLIFDYTFFCAIEPDMRFAWAQKMADILKPDGELITLMFPIDDHVGGPPYRVSVSDYEDVLHPMGFKAISILDNDLAVQPRKGREKLGRWKRSADRSSL